MKKLFVVGALSAGLVACGGGGEGSSNGNTAGTVTPPVVVDVGQIATPASNVLTVKGEQLEKQVAITQDLYDISVHASGNQPIDNVTFHVKPDQYEWSGGINLQGKQARLYHLAFDAKGTERLSCSSWPECFKNSAYQLTPNEKDLLLDISFNQAGNELLHGNSLNGKPVSVSGTLAFKIPAEWPVAKSKRFPVFNVQGEMLWDGESFTVYKIDPPEGVYTPHLDIFYRLYLTGKEGRKITMGVSINTNQHYMEVDIDDKDRNYIFSTRNDASDYTRYWSQDDQMVKLKLSNLKLRDYSIMNNRLHVLSGSLDVPKPRFDVTVDGESITTRRPATEEVGAVNTTKYYTISLDSEEYDENGNHVRLSNALNLYHEIDGHVWLTYYGDHAAYHCGSKTQGCPGLSLAADQKTWRFNNVNIGSSRVNGIYYFLGIEGK